MLPQIYIIYVCSDTFRFYLFIPSLGGGRGEVCGHISGKISFVYKYSYLCAHFCNTEIAIINTFYYGKEKSIHLRQW
jgi:hypothetical protein